MKDRTLRITHTLYAPIEDVWDAWTNPESMKQWLSPEGMTTPDASVDLKVGGAYRVIMEGKNMPNPDHNGQMAVGGEYLEIEKPTKLVFTWLWEDSPVDTHTTKISLLFNKIDENTTELTITHSGFADENMQKEHDMGWKSTLRKLDMFIKKS